MHRVLHAIGRAWLMPMVNTIAMNEHLVEELWHKLRRRFLANRVIDTVEDLIEASRHAWNAAHQPGFIKPVTGFSWLPPLTARRLRH
jgi:hypothetical protein